LSAAKSGSRSATDMALPDFAALNPGYKNCETLGSDMP